LLESIGTRGVAPFKAVLTHGFVLDEQGRKMSKSLGNVTRPQEVTAKYGADILRLWVMNSDTRDDLRIGKNILEQQAELYRRIRNTCAGCWARSTALPRPSGWRRRTCRTGALGAAPPVRAGCAGARGRGVA
jgi:isoleucyl-tRNA synthetase